MGRKSTRRRPTPKRRTLPGHFRVDGLPKMPYTSLEKAREAASRHGKNVYTCDFCGSYHIGS